MATNEVKAEDLGVLRWAHKRLGEMGYELTDEDDEEHPLGWWEAQRASDWAHALEARAQLVAETWAAYADTFGVIGWKHHRCSTPCDYR
jgi:hypothetical protein